MLQQQLNPQEDVTETGTVRIDLHELVLQCVFFAANRTLPSGYVKIAIENGYL